MRSYEERMPKEIGRLAASFIEREAGTDPMISVTHAESGKTLKNVTIFVSVFPDSREAEALNFLKRKRGEFREFLKKNFGAKFLPFIDFEIDLGEKNRIRIEEISNEK